VSGQLHAPAPPRVLNCFQFCVANDRSRDFADRGIGVLFPAGAQVILSQWLTKLVIQSVPEISFLGFKVTGHEALILLNLSFTWPDSVLDIASGYGLDDRGVEVRFPVESRIVSTSSRPAVGSAQPRIHRVPGALSPVVKWDKFMFYLYRNFSTGKNV
jgi:hypothetical protein